MEESDRDAGTFVNSAGQVHHSDVENPLWAGSSSSAGEVHHKDVENPLWAGNSSTEDPGTAPDIAPAQSNSAGNATASELAADEFPPQFPSAQNGEFLEASARQNCQQQQQQQQRTEAEQATMMSAYVDKFGPSPFLPVRPVMGAYYPIPTPGPPTRRGMPSVLPDIDPSYRPGSLQEAICMYIDFLMAENELRTRISECAVALPAPPLDFHREEYYRDVMCRPVNFPTARFRDWLKRYNVDIEITDPDGQTVSQTTFAPATPVSPECPDRDGSWSYVDGVPGPVPPYRRCQRSATSISQGTVICREDTRPVQLGQPFLQPQADPQGTTHIEIHTPVDFTSTSASPVPLYQASGSQGTAHIQVHAPVDATHVEMHGSVDFTSPQANQVPLYQAQDAAPRAVEGCGYGALLGQSDEIKEELPGMAVSGWPDVGLDQPESSRTGTCTVVDSQVTIVI